MQNIVTSCAHICLSSEWPATSLRHKESLRVTAVACQHVHIKLTSVEACIPRQDIHTESEPCGRCAAGTMSLKSNFLCLNLCETAAVLRLSLAAWRTQKSPFIRNKMNLAPPGCWFWLSHQGHPHFGVCWKPPPLPNPEMMEDIRIEQLCFVLITLKGLLRNKKWFGINAIKGLLVQLLQVLWAERRAVAMAASAGQMQS